MLRAFVPILAVAAAGCSIIEAPDPADPALGPAPAAFALVDVDADGQIVPAEWNAYGNAVFVAIDADGDNEITVREMERAFDIFDIDGNGELSPDEADITILDRNKDGRIERAEWNGHLFLHGLESGRDHRVSAKELQVRRFETFTSLDRNATGRISRLELDRGAPSFSLFRF